jgi:hypothetical protein
MVAGFISERWPASNRNPGRLLVGTPGRIKSESALWIEERRSVFESLDDEGVDCSGDGEDAELLLTLRRCKRRRSADTMKSAT